jgi:uncharacterized repeat protein (TIGR01451 family)
MLKFTNYLSYLPKSVSALFGVATAFMVAFSASASAAVQIESTIGVANVTKGDTTYTSGVNAGYDEVVKVQLWYHNMENANSGKVANNLTVKFDVPTGQGASQTIKGTVKGDNTNTVVSTANVNLGRSDAYLEYIPGSAKWRHNAGTNDSVNYVTEAISDNVVTSGAGVNLEDANPCFNFEATVTILMRVRVPSVEVVKSVATPGSNAGWKENVTVAPGDEVKFLFAVNNNGNSRLTNVILGDVMPEGLTLVNGSTVLTNGNNPNGVELSSNKIASGGLNLGNYAVGGWSYVTIKAKVAGADAFECGTTKLVNKAVAKSDKAVIRTDTANVTVKKDCQEEPEFEYDCSALNVVVLDKDAREVKARAVTTMSDNVSLVGTEIDFGDGSAVVTTNPANHQYDAEGKYTITATVAFQLDNESKTVKEVTCSNTVEFSDEVEYCTIPGKTNLPVDSPECKEDQDFCTIPGKTNLPVDSPECVETPPELPNTGAESAIIGLFGATSAIAAAYGYIQDRRSV